MQLEKDIFQYDIIKGIIFNNFSFRNKKNKFQ